MAQNCYIIKIFDQNDLILTPILEFTPKGSPNLSWQGGEEKDTSIIGSSLSFGMVDENYLDGRFLDLYTGNESRYRVELLKIEVQNGVNTEILIWRGFLLPEQYSEPYTNGFLNVNFTASCGLGRLKGKFLDESFYEARHTYTSIIAQCLQQTSNLGNIYLDPAIENATGVLWHQIDLNGQTFIDNSKQEDCYKILERLTTDTLCSIYHEYGHWFIVGYNKRAVEKVNYYVYDSNGVFLENKRITKKPFNVNQLSLTTPIIEVISPLKRVTVSNEVTETKIPETIFKETSDGWIINGQTFAHYNPRNLLYNNYQPDANGATWVTISTDDQKLVLLNTSSFDETQFLFLREKIYVKKGERLKFSADFSLTRSSINETITDADLAKQGFWDDLIQIVVVIDDFTPSFTTQEVSFICSFNEDKKSINTKDFIVEENGYMDIRLFQLIGGPNQETIRFVKVDGISIEQLEYNEEEIFESEINEDFSIEQEIELSISDDIKKDINVFLLENEKVKDKFLYYQNIDILSNFIDDGVEYTVADTFDVFPIKDFPNRVQLKKQGALSFIDLTDVRVIYNYNNTSFTVFSYTAPGGEIITSNDEVRVGIYDYTYPQGDKLPRESWVDSVSEQSPQRFGQAVANIYRSLYKDPHNTLELRIKGLCSISSLISFFYREQKTFYPLRVSWDLTNGITEGLYSEAFYGEIEIAPLPISVYAGEDIFILNTTSQASLSATVTTVNSFIVDVRWEVLEGNASIGASALLQTNVYDLSDVTRFRITVTDNFGQVATDEVSIIRQVPYSLDLVKTFENSFVENGVLSNERIFEFVLTPPLNASIITVSYRLQIRMQNNLNGVCGAFVIVQKSGRRVLEKIYSKPAIGDPVTTERLIVESFDVSLIPGEQLLFSLRATAFPSALITGFANTGISLLITNVLFQNQSGKVVTPLPILKGVSAQVT